MIRIVFNLIIEHYDKSAPVPLSVETIGDSGERVAIQKIRVVLQAIFVARGGVAVHARRRPPE